jgi:hypothetical protein
MSSDDFLDGLKGAWQGPDVDLGDVASQVEEGARKLRKERNGRLSQLAIFWGFTAWFGWQVLETGEFLFHVAAVVFLTAGLIALGDFIFLRRASGEAYLQGTDAVLDQAEKQARIGLRLAEGVKAHAVLLVVCAALIFGHEVIVESEPGRGLVASFVILIGGVFLGVAQRARMDKARTELEELRRLRNEWEGES